MTDDTDAILQGLIARIAVTEQVTLSLLAATAHQYEEPARFAAAVLAETRERFAGIGPQDGRGAEHLRDRAFAVLDELGNRVAALMPPGPESQ